MKRLVLGILSLTMVMSAILWSVPSALAVESGGVGGRPAYPDPNIPRTDSIFIFKLDPGGKAENGVKLFNNSGETKTIEVYPVDSEASSGGAFACSQKLQERRNVGSWIKLEKDKVTLDAGASEIIPFTLSVPSSAPAGEHNGCIAIEEVNQTPQAVGNGIALSFRSGIRVAVTVSGDITKGLSFTNLVTSPAENSPAKRVITTSLRNSGNVSLDTDIKVRITSLIGTTMRTNGGEFPVLANGQSDFNFEVDELFWGGLYFLKASADYNDSPGGTMDSREKNATSYAKTHLVFVTPKPLALLIEILVLVGVLVGIRHWWMRRRTHKQWQTRGDVYVVQTGDNLQQIAEHFGLKWRTIARVNKLQAPYQLTPGQELKVLTSQNNQKKDQSKQSKKPTKTTAENNDKPEPKSKNKSKKKN
ncbi:LysM peptidoglycan-binding domain-containing protein [Candidatus Dojkabacteria bacterium]|uniref:LysM peptidoglycan-binding domain-containing protein n=1 Tax=Candidatus Dojkabacteria bacterium TaxID=2099670 RepID=A0A5C7J3W7_9BACT|nr:MAG: LysM peptidoglycan-binding domain-containing protein [Candidatus Dojkabacteria bacterium]